MTDILIRNAEVFTPEKVIEGGFVTVKDGRIEEVGEGNSNIQAEKEIDAGGMILCPGFIEVHIQGCFGYDVWGGKEGLRGIAKSLLKTGTTSFLATTEYQSKTLGELSDYSAGSEPEADCLGIHLEGPFVSPNKKGALPEFDEIEPNISNIEKIWKESRGKLRMMTIAPEVPGTLEVISWLVEHGVVASIGHTNASYEEARTGIDTGITHSTHLANAMKGISHRDPGALGAVLLASNVTVQIIADGVHLHPKFIELAYRMKGFSGITCITDSVGPAGMEDGKFELGGHGGVVYKKDGAVRTEDGILAGSCLTMDSGVRYLNKNVGIPIREAIETATLTPASVLGLKDRGVLSRGAIADILLLSKDVEIQKVIKGGVLV